MRRLFILSLIVVSFSCSVKTNNYNTNLVQIRDINIVLNDWHKAAANANFETYFSKMTNDAIFIGTDATENWTLSEFKTFSKPFFDKGKAWSFKSLERNIYFSADKKMAWFDELLDTQMELCRGSGVLIKTTNGWKIKHYVLSISIPNENVNEVVLLKKERDSILKKSLNNR